MSKEREDGCKMLLVMNVRLEREEGCKMSLVMNVRLAARGQDRSQPQIRLTLRKPEVGDCFGEASNSFREGSFLLSCESIAGETPHCNSFNFAHCAKHFTAFHTSLATTDQGYNIVRKEAQQVPHGLPPLWKNLFPHPKEDML